MAVDTSLLRQIPKVDELLAHPRVAALSSHLLAAEATRQVLGELRERILAGNCLGIPDREEIAELILSRAERNNIPSLRGVINATGIILHTNLGRAPLADSAVDAVLSVADSYSTLEYNVEAGARGSRFSHVEGLLTKLTGAEAAFVVNNNAAAVLIILSALAVGKEVVVSRGELVEIGGAFRIPEVMEQSGCVLREVGATNRTRAADYERAIDPERTGALLKAHTSNYKILGFTEEVSMEEMVDLGKKHNLPVLYDLGSGSLLPLQQFGIHDEPCVMDSLNAGVDVVSFSGDKLLGGPQAGIIVGKRAYIERMKKHPLARAMRIDKLTLAALEGTLRLYLDPERAVEEIPTLRMLGTDQPTLRRAAERLAALLEPIGDQVQVVDEVGQVGGGSVPTRMLPSAAVAILPKDITVTELEHKLRQADRPIIARIAKDRLLLDLRAVREPEYGYVAHCLLSILGEEARP